METNQAGCPEAPAKKLTERELVVALKEADDLLESLAVQVKDAKKKYEDAEGAILQHLEDSDKEATAEYEGVGKVQRKEPKLKASVNAENFDAFVEFLKTEDRLDIVKPTINAGTLNTFIGERLTMPKPADWPADKPWTPFPKELVNVFFVEEVKLVAPKKPKARG